MLWLVCFFCHGFGFLRFTLCVFVDSFLRGLFQYGDLHFGHFFGFGFLSIQICSHRWHFACGNSGMSLVSIVFGLSILFYLYYYDDIVVYKCCF